MDFRRISDEFAQEIIRAAEAKLGGQVAWPRLARRADEDSPVLYPTACQAELHENCVGAVMPKRPFDLEAFLSSVDGGRSQIKYRTGQIIFRQADPCDAVLYMRAGQCKITVLSEQGKEAVVAIHGDGTSSEKAA